MVLTLDVSDEINLSKKYREKLSMQSQFQWRIKWKISGEIENLDNKILEFENRIVSDYNISRFG